MESNEAVNMGQAKQKRLAGRERWRTAVHEASHAVALNHYGMLEFVTIDEEYATKLLLDQHGPNKVDLGSDTHRGFAMARVNNVQNYCIGVVAGPEGERLLLPMSLKIARTWASDADTIHEIAKDLNIKADQVDAFALAAREEWQRLARARTWTTAI